MRLHGIEVSLDEISKYTQEEKAVSLQQLSDATSKIGHPLVAVQVRYKDWGCPEGNFIAHLNVLEKDHPNEPPSKHGHYMIARRFGDEVRVISPPGKALRMSTKQFFTAWSGYALLRPEAVPDPSAISYRQWKATLLLGGGSAILLATGFYFIVLRRRQRILTPALNATILMLLGVISGCSKADSKPVSPLTVLGARTYEFKPVKEGESIETTFQFRNDGALPLSLSVGKSCGCTSAKLSSSSLSPGESGSVAVKVDTIGRGGGFNQYVEIFGKGKSLTTFWIVGKIIPGLRLVVHPHEIDLSKLRVGAEQTEKLEIEAFSAGEKIPVNLLVRDCSSNSAITWTVDWTKREPKSETDYKLNIRQHFECVIRFRALKPGALAPPFLQVVNVEPDGKPGTWTPVLLLGKISGDYDSQPNPVFLGVLNDSETYKRSIFVKQLGSSVTLPEIRPSSAWLRADPPRRVDNGFIVDVSIPPTGKVGLINETLEIGSDQKAGITVPIVGMRR
jgi:hypothetical protein